ncbi:origin recognition complex subunit 5 C-terminus-domain-containing protein [Lipomyces orientalis]|uniref:Origin recognition complex subunit 5 C-terminus-domain-containing protein n=1 Tax=Lipomyces orientalis TaxID=1233043 RepID=A0ACC3TXK7_9ASCO
MSDLTSDQLQELALEFPARYNQFDLLNSLISKDKTTNPTAIALTGQPSSGKTCVLRRFLREVRFSHTWLSCDECVSLRVLLQRILAALRAIGTEDPNKLDYSIMCHNFTLFVTQLNDVLRALALEEAHFVVLDRIDELGEPYESFYQLVINIGEMLRYDGITFILISSSSEPRSSVTSTFPHIYFPPYRKAESLAILRNQTPGSIRSILGPTDRELSDVQLTSLWSSYCQVIIDTYFPLYGPDIQQLKATAREAFSTYAQPVLDGVVGILPSNRDSQSGFVKLYKINQPLLTSEELVRNSFVSYVQSAGGTGAIGQHDMPIYSKYLLCAAYLASYNKPRYDIRLFSRIRESRRRIRKSTSHKAKDKINGRNLAPSPFEYERLLAIFQCIVPEKIDSATDIQIQFATLATLKLVTRAGSDSSGGSSMDILESRTKWRVNVSWDIILQIARDIKLQLENYLME